ncbi:hypothetical protein ACFE04_009363 [Oxalis oulophora]
MSNQQQQQVEEVSERVNKLTITNNNDEDVDEQQQQQQRKNRIQVSNTKKPLFFYVNLAKRYMQQYNEVELSALGMVYDSIGTMYAFDSRLAIATVVTVAEILKNNGLAIEKKITTSTVDMKEDLRGRPVQKAKVFYVLFCQSVPFGFDCGKSFKYCHAKWLW